MDITGINFLENFLILTIIAFGETAITSVIEETGPICGAAGFTAVLRGRKPIHSGQKNPTA